MSEKQPKRRPTDAEIKILRVLWEHGARTVREVHELISAKETIGYTTVLKVLQIMTDKGLVERDTDVRPMLYRASEPQRKTQRSMVRDLLDRAFGGSASDLALQALSLRKSSPEELREIRALLDKLEGDDR